MNLKSTTQIANELGIEIHAVSKRFSYLNIKCIKRVGNTHMYSKAQINSIMKKGESFLIKYYPLKTTETFYIYESKINKTTFDF
jgi:hypothetical protein